MSYARIYIVYSLAPLFESFFFACSDLRNGIEPRSSTGTAIRDRLFVISIIDPRFWSCMIGELSPEGLFLILFGMWIVKCIAGMPEFIEPHIQECPMRVLYSPNHYIRP